MIAKTTTHDNMPARIDEIIIELKELRQIVDNRIKKAEEIPKYLNIDAAIEYLKLQGFSMSKSTLYKLSAKDKIPKHKIDNKLYFNPQNLEKWIINKTNI